MKSELITKRTPMNEAAPPPLATDITAVWRKHSADWDPETSIDFATPDGPLAFRNLSYTQSVLESKALNTKEGPFIIIAASGMMTAGRVVHHLRHSISDSRNSIFITGYQAVGTLGRRLLEGATSVELLGEWFSVRAAIEVFNEFSAHADGEQLRDWLGQWRGLQHAILVHGEPEEAGKLESCCVSDTRRGRSIGRRKGKLSRLELKSQNAKPIV